MLDNKGGQVEDNLIRVFHNQLTGISHIEFDLYNSKGILIYNKGKKIDPDFLLMSSSIDLYRKKETHNDTVKEAVFYDDEISQFLKELFFIAFKNGVDTVKINCSNDKITILFLKDSSVVEESDIDASLYTEITDKLKTLFVIEIDYEKNEYSGLSSINILNKKVNLLLHLELNDFNKFNMTFEIFQQ